MLTPYFLTHITDGGTCRRYLFVVTWTIRQWWSWEQDPYILAVSPLLTLSSITRLPLSQFTSLLSWCYSSAVRDFTVTQTKKPLQWWLNQTPGPLPWLWLILSDNDDGLDLHLFKWIMRMEINILQSINSPLVSNTNAVFRLLCCFTPILLLTS